MSIFNFIISVIISCIFSFSCSGFDIEKTQVSAIRIPLSGMAANPEAEFSSLAWYGDKLILMPENPEYFGDNHFFTMKKSEIISYLNDTSSAPPKTSLIRLSGDFSKIIPGYEGYEALEFIGDKAFLTIEAHTDSSMTGWLVSGTMNANGTQLDMDTSRQSQIPVPGYIPNYSAEALTVFDNKLVAFYEANGKMVNASPAAYQFDTNLNYLGKIKMPAIEYRITDACNTINGNTVWLINYFYPREKTELNPADDIFSTTGETETRRPVERLIHLSFNKQQISIVDKQPLDILITSQSGRNWEGVAALDNKGFLIVTDEYPETILAFVPFVTK